MSAKPSPGRCGDPQGIPRVPDIPVLADVLRFDNTYSFLHSKKVSYSVEVLLPDTASAQQIQGESPSHSP